MPTQSVPDEQVLRRSMIDALTAALERARSGGYTSEIDRLAFFAVVAFIDETVLKLKNKAFGGWAKRTLQEEMFEHNRAGEVFFEYLGSLLRKQDAIRDTADVLEVFCLCMLLGFQGQYAVHSGMAGSVIHVGDNEDYRHNGNVESLIRQTRQKIDQIRGRATFLPDGPPVPEVRATATTDGWGRALATAALVLLGVTLLAYGGFWVILNAGATQLS